MRHFFLDRLDRNDKFFREQHRELARRNLSLAKVLALAVIIVYLTFQLISVILYGGLDLRPMYAIPSLFLVLLWLLGEALYRRFGTTRFLSLHYPFFLQCYLMGFAIWMDTIAKTGFYQIYTPLALMLGSVLFFLPLKVELLIDTMSYLVYLLVAWQVKEPAFAQHAFFQTTIGYVLSVIMSIFILDIRLQEVEAYAKLDQERKFREEIETRKTEAERLLTELQISHAIVEAVTDIYYVLYECDLEHNTFTCIRGSAYVRNFTKQYTGAYECLQAMSFAAVVPEDREMVARFYDTHQWPKWLKEKDNLSIEFRGVETGWSRGNLIVAQRDSEGVPTRVLSAIQDIHETKLKSIAYQQKLQEALMQAQHANQAKTDFLNSMSHDIRTPMNAIIGFSTLAQSHLTDPDRLADYLEKISTAGDHLLSLINDVLDMSRIESGNVRIREEEGSLRDFMHELGNILQPDIHARNLRYDMEIRELRDDYVYFDKLRLSQVLINIISNSIKYTDPDGSIHVSLEELGEPKDAYAAYRFIVQDSGVGIKPEFLEHIFEPFTREETSTISGIQGTGLGLAITKNLTDLMDGQIHVDSKVGEGTRMTLDFHFRIAQKKPQPAVDAGEEVTAWPHFDGARILLVEDNELNREIAMELLQEEGIRIDSAENGKIGAEMFAQKPADYYSLILMDIQMPVMDGYEATKAIRQMDREDAQRIPIIALTANAFTEDSRRAFENGMDEYLTKPFHMDDLNRMLSRYLEREGGKD